MRVLCIARKSPVAVSVRKVKDDAFDPTTTDTTTNTIICGIDAHLRLPAAFVEFSTGVSSQNAISVLIRSTDRSCSITSLFSLHRYEKVHRAKRTNRIQVPGIEKIFRNVSVYSYIFHWLHGECFLSFWCCKLQPVKKLYLSTLYYCREPIVPKILQ